MRQYSNLRMEHTLFNFFWVDIVVTLVMAAIYIAFMFVIITIFNDELGKLSLYHTPKTKNNSNGEPFFTKCKKIIKVYLRLSIFIFVPIYATLVFDGMSNPDTIVMIAEIGTIAILIVSRILMNPTWDHPIIRENKNNEKLIESVLLFKERIFSLFFAFISITWIFLFLLLISTIGQPEVMPLVPKDIVGATLLILLIDYIISLVIIAIITEKALFEWQPIVQTQL